MSTKFNYIVGLPLRRIVRKKARAPNHIPVLINNSFEQPTLCGSYGGYETKGGRPIRHPSAYSKKGWSNMVYVHSTERVEVSESFVLSCIKNYPEVTFAGKKLYLNNKKSLRKAERILSKYERHIATCSSDKNELLFNAAISLIENKILFCKTGNVKIPSDKRMILQLLGHKPTEIALLYGARLSNKEASDWIDNNLNYTPAQYLYNKLIPKKYVEYNNGNPIYQSTFSINSSVYLPHEIRETDVIRWLASVINNSTQTHQLCKERVFRGPHGENLTFRYINKLDEIKSEDLTNGLKTGVKIVFENAAKRKTNEYEELLKKNNEPLIKHIPKVWPGDTKNWKMLITGADLIKEGKELNHCVAQYIPYVRKRESIIVAITGDDGSRSTVELGTKINSGAMHFTVNQHYSYGNSEPSDACKKTLTQLLETIKNADSEGNTIVSQNCR